MVYRGGLFSGRILSLLFLSFAFVLAIFSLFYADWYQKNVTGLVAESVGGGNKYLPPPTLASTPANGRESYNSLQRALTEASYIALQTSLTAQNVLFEVSLYASTVSESQQPPIGAETEPIIPEGITVPPITPSLNSNLCALNPNSVQCIASLTQVIDLVNTAIVVVSKNYDNILQIENKYSFNKQIRAYAEYVGSNLYALEKISDELKQQFTHTVEQIQARRQRIAEITIDYEQTITENKLDIENYFDKYGTKIPVAPKSNPDVSVGVLPICSVPTDIMNFGEADDVDFGDSGVNLDGDLCNLDVPKPKPLPSSVFTLPSSSVTNIPPVTAPAMPPPFSSPVGGNGVFSFYFQPQETGEGGFSIEAMSVALSPGGQFVLGFFSSQSLYGLKKEIADFVEKVTSGVFGLGGQNLETGPVYAEISNEQLGTPIPWVLWIALLANLVIFLFFGSYLLPEHSRLILDGRRAIAKKDFSKAVEIYRELTTRYRELRDEHGEDIRQDILSYFVVLRAGLRAVNFRFELNNGSNKFPLITILKLSSLKRIATDAQRVEQLLRDALHDKKRASGLAPIIASLYSRLERKDKEKLAPLYERFVYGLRDK